MPKLVSLKRIIASFACSVYSISTSTLDFVIGYELFTVTFFMKNHMGLVATTCMNLSYCVVSAGQTLIQHILNQCTHNGCLVKPNMSVNKIRRIEVSAFHSTKLFAPFICIIHMLPISHVWTAACVMYYFGFTILTFVPALQPIVFV